MTVQWETAVLGISSHFVPDMAAVGAAMLRVVSSAAVKKGAPLPVEADREVEDGRQASDFQVAEGPDVTEDVTSETFPQSYEKYC